MSAESHTHALTVMRETAAQLNQHAKAKAAALQKKCDDFNAKCSVGDKVVYRYDNSDTITVKTATKAYVMAGYDAVIQLMGIASCHLLERVTKLAAPTGDHHGE